MSERQAKIAILDYGMGNLRSVEKALEHVGALAEISDDPERVRAADGVILPGVGAFPKAMEEIRARGLDQLIAERRASGAPILGICLGLQLLFESTSELGGATGLGLLAGGVDGLEAAASRSRTSAGRRFAGSTTRALVDGIESETPFYFVHSFAPRPASPPRTCSAPPPTAGASPARPSARTSSASSSTRRSRAPPGCACSRTSPAICAAVPA